MTGPQNVPGQLQSPDMIQHLSTLALVRTTFSSERTVLSWIRTSASLYAFGFSVAKFTDFLDQQEREMSTGLDRLGLALILVGVLGLVLSLVEHMRRVRTMKRLGLPDWSPSWLPSAATVALLSVGIVTMIGIAAGSRL